MEHQRISMSDIVIGAPLPWDVFDENDRLLLRKGHVIERERQAEALIARGLFVDPDALQNAVKPAEKPSVLRLLNTSNKRLEHLLHNVESEAGMQGKLLEVAETINRAVTLNADIALGCILLNQQAGGYVVRHCIDTAVVSLLIARNMKKSSEEILAITAASLTMNIGMLHHQEHLQSRQETLSDKEREHIQNHPQEGVNVLQEAGVDHPEWLSYVLHHHENEDGSGYPLGKSSEDIPQNAKIISLADRYCARVSHRHYRKSLLPNAALRDILMTDKKAVDPMLVTSFIRELGVYPTGTFVQLENGEVGVVTGKGESSTTPCVHALVGSRGVPLAFPIKRDTALTHNAIREVVRGEHASVSMQQLWGEEASL